MMKNIKPFSLNLYKQNPKLKVLTTNGDSVKILDINLKGNGSIVASIRYEGEDIIFRYDELGHCINGDSKFDLVIATKTITKYIALEHEITDWSDRLIANWCLYDTPDEVLEDYIDDSGRLLKEFITVATVTWEEI